MTAKSWGVTLYQAGLEAEGEEDSVLRAADYIEDTKAGDQPPVLSRSRRKFRGKPYRHSCRETVFPASPSLHRFLRPVSDSASI